MHIEDPLPVPVREVGYFLDEKDVDCLRPLLHAGASAASPASYFSPELFFAHRPAGTREQMLRFLTDEIAAREDVPDDFLDQIRARERSASTAFGNGVAMPHPLVPVGKRTFITVALADGPIAWGSTSVRAVFLITVSTDETEDLHALYDALLALTSTTWTSTSKRSSSPARPRAAPSASVRGSAAGGGVLAARRGRCLPGRPRRLPCAFPAFTSVFVAAWGGNSRCGVALTPLRARGLLSLSTAAFPAATQ